jgi:hypothetical protein
VPLTRRALVALLPHLREQAGDQGDPAPPADGLRRLDLPPERAALPPPAHRRPGVLRSSA